MRKPLLAVIAVLVAGLLGLLLWQIRRGPAPIGETASGPDAAVARDVTDRRSARQPPTPLTTRGQPPELRNEADVELYLDELERAIRVRGKVTEEDRRAGHEALGALRDALDAETMTARLAAWDARMDKLDMELGVAPIQRDLDRLAAAIQAERDPDARRKLVTEYVQVAARLPKVFKDEAMARLRELQK